MQKIIKLSIAAVALFGLSCTGIAQENKEHLLNNEAFKASIEKVNVQLIDVRTAKEYEAGTIEYAQNVDVLGDDFIEKTKELSKEQPVYIFCKSGKRSENARNILLEQGFKEVYELDGGYSQWK